MNRMEWVETRRKHGKEFWVIKTPDGYYLLGTIGKCREESLDLFAKMIQAGQELGVRDAKRTGYTVIKASLVERK